MELCLGVLFPEIHMTPLCDLALHLILHPLQACYMHFGAYYKEEAPYLMISLTNCLNYSILILVGRPLIMDIKFLSQRSTWVCMVRLICVVSCKAKPVGLNSFLLPNYDDSICGCIVSIESLLDLAWESLPYKVSTGVVRERTPKEVHLASST